MPLPSLGGHLIAGSVNPIRLTKRAPDKWDSLRFMAWLWNHQKDDRFAISPARRVSSLHFSAFEFFLLPSFFQARPLAGNAPRWALAEASIYAHGKAKAIPTKG